MINEGISLFNNSDFFAAHDFFEYLWMEAKNEEKLFFQGMVQVSVGCYHYICGNFNGSKSQLKKSIEKLNLYKPVYYSIDISKLLLDIKKLLNYITENHKLNNPAIISIIIPKINTLTNV